MCVCSGVQEGRTILFSMSFGAFLKKWSGAGLVESRGCLGESDTGICINRR